MANDALIEDGNTQWWLELLEIQKRRRRRDIGIKDERADQSEKENE